MPTFQEALDALRQAAKRVNPDPCNRSADRRNAQALNQIVDDILDAFDNIDPTATGGGTNVTPFQITERIDANTGRANKIMWDVATAAWVFGEEIIVTDWTVDNQFDCNIQVGHQGVALFDSEKDEWPIITLVGLARWLIGSFVSRDDTDPMNPVYTFNIDEYFGAYPNIVDPGVQLTNVLDPANVDPGLIVTDKAFLVFDDVRCSYILLNAFKPGGGGAPSECLVKIKDPGESVCDPVQENMKCAINGWTQELPGAAADLCNPLVDSTQVWCFDARKCGIGQVKNEEIYLACKVSDLFDASVGGPPDPRPVYAIISEVDNPTEDTVRVIEIVGTEIVVL